MIDVALTPADLHPADIAVVIDVLRATSTATRALAAGYRRVLCAETIELALGDCAPQSVLDVVPTVTAAGGGVAMVCDATGRRDADWAVGRDGTVPV